MRLQGKEGIVEVGITLRLGSVWVERGWGEAVAGTALYLSRTLWEAVRETWYPFENPAIGGQEVRQRRNLVHGWTNTPFAFSMMRLS